MAVATDTRKTGIAAGPTLLGASAVAASITGTLTETTLATVTVPGGAMGLNGGLHIYTTWSMTNSANTKTQRVRLGGAAGTIYAGVALTTATTLHDFRRIRNRNSLASQVGSLNAAAGSTFSSSGVAVVTSTIDTSVSQDVAITAQLGNTGETITLESYEVWLVP